MVRLKHCLRNSYSLVHTPHRILLNQRTYSQHHTVFRTDSASPILSSVYISTDSDRQPYNCLILKSAGPQAKRKGNQCISRHSPSLNTDRPVEFSAAGFAEIFAGWRSVWHVSPGTAWQSPWLGACLPDTLAHNRAPRTEIPLPSETTRMLGLEKEIKVELILV